MIRIERVSQVPETVLAALAEPSTCDLLLRPEQKALREKESFFMATVYDADVPLCFVGLTRQSFCGLVGVWFLVCKDYGMKYARKTRNVWAGIVEAEKNIQSLIDLSNPRNTHFARFLGMCPTGELVQMNNRTYGVYEAKYNG
jgi:hypothetical protein